MNPNETPFVVALVGNPNTGKTSLFNALTGYRRHVANYPGVTVDAARGAIRNANRKIELLDLPGTYGLAAASPDEALVGDVLNGRMAEHGRPQAIVAVADASNLSRCLYLVNQLIETERPVVLAINMMDVATARGLKIDAKLLASRLGIPVVPVVATKPATLQALLREIERLGAATVAVEKCGESLPAALHKEAAALRADGAVKTFAEAVRQLLDPPRENQRDGQGDPLRSPSVKEGPHPGGPSAEREAVDRKIRDARARLATIGIDGPAAEIRARYSWLAAALKGVVSRPEIPVVTWSDRLDRMLTHKVGGLVALLFTLLFVFQSIFSWASPLMNWIDGGFGWLSGKSAEYLPTGPLQSFVADGLIAGVGGVLVFLPQILILFGFIAILEDCGYLARAAYMMDRIMRGLGLSGRAFIPLLSSFACAVPAILGTRTISDWRERFVTILIAPFMSCSARLPVYILLISAFVPDNRMLGGWLKLQALVMLAMYLVGVVVAVPLAWILKKAVFAGPSAGFVMELPSYKWPRWQAVVQRMWSAGAKFVAGAGTVIVLVNLVVWAAAYFPHSEKTRSAVELRAASGGWSEEQREHELAGAYLRESYLGRAGHAIEPLFRPLGWDWRISVAVLASFPAREVVVATLGSIYNLGADEDESSQSLRAAIQNATWPESGARVFTLPVALSLMVFFALCAQCTSTLVVIGREMRSWVWPMVSFVGMTTIAYFAAWGTVVAARALGW